MIKRFTPLERLVLLAAGMACCASLTAAEPGLDRATALSIARTVDTSPLRHDLVSLTIAGDTAGVLELLQQTATRGDWPAPARDAAIQAYVDELRALPSASVPGEVMTWLKSYQPTSLVRHEDHPQAAVPLFNIRAATAGVENGWLRHAALLEGLALMSSNPRSLVDIYLIESHPAARLGYLEALTHASERQLQGVGKSAVRRLATNPELTPLAGNAALRAGATDLLMDVFILGDGPALAHLMRDSAKHLSVEDNADLMSHTLSSGPVLNAALAMAELAPVAAGQPQAQSALVNHLDHPQLGAAAALALADIASARTLQTLESMLDSDNPLASSRARMALDLNKARSETGAHQ